MKRGTSERGVELELDPPWRWLRYVMLGVAMVAMVAMTGLLPAAEGPWRKDVDLAIAEARGRPLVMVFSAEWCTWCHRLLEEAAADPRIVTALSDTVAVEIDIDRHPHLAQRLSVRGVPATLLVNRAGHLVDRIDGYRPPDEFLPHLEELLVSGDRREGPRLPLWAAADLAERSTAALVADLGQGTTAERRARRTILAQRGDLGPMQLWLLLDHPLLRVRVDASAVLAGLVGPPQRYDPFAVPLERRATAIEWRGVPPAIP